MNNGSQTGQIKLTGYQLNIKDMEILLIILCIYCYSTIKKELQQIVLDITWLVCQPIKWTIKLYKYIR